MVLEIDSLILQVEFIRLWLLFIYDTLKGSSDTHFLHVDMII